MSITSEEIAMVILVFVFIAGLCWGSFLNVVAHRILHDKIFFTARSQCPSCNNIIRWYDNIPLVSWMILRGRCRSCQASISWLYPFIELVTGIVITGLFYKFFGSLMSFDKLRMSGEVTSLFRSEVNRAMTPLTLSLSKGMSGLAHLIFFSALIAATRTDLESMLIPQCFSLWLVPLGLAASYFNLIQITFIESIIGALSGYFLLSIVARLFKKVTRKDGLGVGDMELLALVGSFIGPIGVWFSLMIGSFSGLLLGVIFLLITKQGRTTRIPFGPFLALGAIVYFFLENVIVNFFLV